MNIWAIDCNSNHNTNTNNEHDQHSEELLVAFGEQGSDHHNDHHEHECGEHEHEAALAVVECKHLNRTHTFDAKDDKAQADTDDNGNVLDVDDVLHMEVLLQLKHKLDRAQSKDLKAMAHIDDLQTTVKKLLKENQDLVNDVTKLIGTCERTQKEKLTVKKDLVEVQKSYTSLQQRAQEENEQHLKERGVFQQERENLQEQLQLSEGRIKRLEQVLAKQQPHSHSRLMLGHADAHHNSSADKPLSVGSGGHTKQKSLKKQGQSSRNNSSPQLQGHVQAKEQIKKSVSDTNFDIAAKEKEHHNHDEEQQQQVIGAMMSMGRSSRRTRRLSVFDFTVTEPPAMSMEKEKENNNTTQADHEQSSPQSPHTRRSNTRSLRTSPRVRTRTASSSDILEFDTDITNEQTQTCTPSPSGGKEKKQARQWSHKNKALVVPTSNNNDDDADEPQQDHGPRSRPSRRNRDRSRSSSSKQRSRSSSRDVLKNEARTTTTRQYVEEHHQALLLPLQSNKAGKEEHDDLELVVGSSSALVLTVKNAAASKQDNSNHDNGEQEEVTDTATAAIHRKRTSKSDVMSAIVKNAAIQIPRNKELIARGKNTHAALVERKNALVARHREGRAAANANATPSATATDAGHPLNSNLRASTPLGGHYQGQDKDTPNTPSGAGSSPASRTTMFDKIMRDARQTLATQQTTQDNSGAPSPTSPTTRLG
jgi:hypothetical protein